MRSASGASGLKFGWCFMKRSKNWSVGLVVKRGMGNNSFLGNKKGRPDFLQIALEKIFCCGKRKRPESKFPFDSGLGLVFFRLCDAFTLVRIPSGVFHIIQKRHAVTGLFRPSKREKSPEFRAFFVPASFLASKPGAPGGTRTPDLLVRSQTLYPAELLAHWAVF